MSLCFSSFHLMKIHEVDIFTFCVSFPVLSIDDFFMKILIPQTSKIAQIKPHTPCRLILKMLLLFLSHFTQRLTSAAVMSIKEKNHRCELIK